MSSAAVCPACPARLRPAVPQLPGPPANPASGAHLALCIRHELDVEHPWRGGALPACRGPAGRCRRTPRPGGGSPAIGRLASAAGALQLHGCRLTPHCEHRWAAQVAQHAGARALRTRDGDACRGCSQQMLQGTNSSMVWRRAGFVAPSAGADLDVQWAAASGPSGGLGALQISCWRDRRHAATPAFAQPRAPESPAPLELSCSPAALTSG